MIRAILLLRRGRWYWYAAPLLSACLTGCVTTEKVYVEKPIKMYGEHSKRDCAWLPKGAIPPPNGTYTRDLFNAQAANAEPGDFVVWECEWLDGGVVPGPYGQYHLNQIVRRLPEVPFPVLIQVNLDEKLNAARRLAVINYLAANGISDAEQRVVVGFPREEGLFGDEAEVAYLRGYTGLGNQGYGSPYSGARSGVYGGGLYGGVGGLFGGFRGGSFTGGLFGGGLLGGFGRF